MVLNLSGKTPSSPVANMPPAGYDGSFNLEGPVWIGDTLYASEIASSNAARILEYTTAGGASVFLETAGTNGLAVNSDGDLVVARQLDGTLSIIDIDSPLTAPVVVADEFMSARFNSPNDLIISSTGHYYFTDPDWQAPDPNPQLAERAYHVTPTGTVTAIAGTPDKPNGIALSLDESTLYVTGTNGLVKFPIMDGGTVGTGSSVGDFSGGGDGIGRDCAGNLYFTNGDQIVVYDKDGAKYETAISVGASVTNIAFGGPTNTTMFITSLSPAALRTIEMDIPGFPY
jgi:gluconolactonase